MHLSNIIYDECHILLVFHDTVSDCAQPSQFFVRSNPSKKLCGIQPSNVISMMMPTRYMCSAQYWADILLMTAETPALIGFGRYPLHPSAKPVVKSTTDTITTGMLQSVGFEDAKIA